jgi:DNA polymerase III epsilon subunit family exonuclease
MPMLLSSVNCVSLDVETTGLHPERGARICEIGMLRLRAGKEVQTLTLLVNPGKAIDPAAGAIHGITDLDVANAPDFSGCVDQVLEFIGDDALIGYRIGFDLGFLNNELRLLRRPRFNGEAIDVLYMAREQIKGLERYSLAAVAQRLGVDMPVAHRALADARATAAVFMQICTILQKKDVHDFNEIRSTYRYRDDALDHETSPQHAVICAALQRHGLVHITYQAPDGTVSERDIQPLRIERRGPEFFLIAECALRQDMRSFNVARILECEAL